MTRRSVSSSRRFLRALPVCGLAATLCAVSALAGDKPAEPGGSIGARMREIFSFNRNAVVKVQSSDTHGRIEGTGFYADSTGTIYTVMDVVGDGSDITVFQGLRKLPARLLVSDPRTGIALIKVDAATPFLPLGDSANVDAYTPVVAIGYPYDKPSAWSGGIVASLDKQYFNGSFFQTTHIRANVPVEPGFGGAPVFNLKGEVVGIVVAGVDGNSGCYAVPINAAEKIRTDYKRFGHLNPGWVGISVEDVHNDTLPSTARVTELQSGSPANRAGVREGDILLRVGDVAVHAPEDVFDASFYLTAGDETTVTVLRNGAEQKFTVRAAKNPCAPEDSTASTLEGSELQFETTLSSPAPGR
jgi:serine protease Do